MSEVKIHSGEHEPIKLDGHMEWHGLKLQTITVLPEVEKSKLPLVCMIGGIPRNKENSRDFHPLKSGTFEAYSMEFARRGEASFVMSPVGMGDSEGDTFSHSIEDRIDAWTRAIMMLAEDPRFDADNFSLLGNSMGGHIAIKVSERLSAQGLNVKNLILVSPAAYPDEVEEVNFGSQWGKTAEKYSGSMAQVFEVLKNIRGRVLLSWVQSDRPVSVEKQSAYNEVMDERMRSGSSDTAMSHVGVEHNFRKLNSNPSDNLIEIGSLDNAAKIFADWQTAG